MGAGLGRQGTVKTAAGFWIGNPLFAVVGLGLLPRMEQFRGESRWLSPFGRFRTWFRLIRLRTARARAAAARAANVARVQREAIAPSSASFPQLTDLYVLPRFFSYFATLMAPFLFLFDAFPFFEL